MSDDMSSVNSGFSGESAAFGARTLRALEYDKVLEHLAALCVSPSGREAALALRPFPDAAEAVEAALLYDECLAWTAESAGAQGDAAFSMASFPDVGGVERYLQSHAEALDVDALWALRETLSLAGRAVAAIDRDDACERRPRLLALAARVPLPRRTAAALRRCLSDDGRIRDESSPELMLARAELRSLHQNCMRKVKDFAKQYNIAHYLQDEFMTLASDRYVLPLKANFKGRLQGVVHDWSQTGETCYFEPMFLVEINNRLQELKRRERKEERNILIFLTNLAREEAPQISAAAALLARLDVLTAQGALAAAMGGATPATLSAQEGVNLSQARHPLLALARQGAHPVDVLLRPGQRGLLISGGNAGGKTVCLKTLGLTALMALTGLPVPAARGSTLPPWRSIHALIGDEQSLADQASTFTAQIRHLVAAWDSADAETLILLDEFGNGTDPAQGAALAQAVLDGLLDRGVYVAAATHFPALKIYALTHEKIRAASVLFDPGTKKPLFRLAYDQVGASQALDVAREHGLSEEILERAGRYLLVDAGGGDALMARLNALAVEREKEVVELRAERERQHEKLRQMRERFERERRELYDEVRAQAQELMAAWKAGKLAHKQALKETARLRASLAAEAAPEEAAPPLSPQSLRVGRTVLHRAFGKRGVVLEVDARRARVRLDMNGVTLWTEIKDIQAADDPRPMERTGGVHVVSAKKTEGSPLRLDLRGKRADLAISELAGFLDKALLGGWESVEVAHGRGTGVLRRQVHDFLRSFPGIDSFATAPEDRGGDGMTIVHFR